MDLLFTSSLGDADAGDYDRFVDAARGGNYAQARAWGPVACAGRPVTQRYFLAREGGRVVGAAALLRPMAGPLPLPVVIVERGPVCDDPADVARVTEALVAKARLHGVARVQVMPYWTGSHVAPVEAALASVGFRRTQELDGAHAMTLRIELTGKTDEALLAGKDRQALRQRLRQAEKAGATARRGELADVRLLERLYAELMRGQGRGVKPPAYFERLASSIVAGGERGAIFVCMHDAEPISAIFVARHGGVVTFVIGAGIAAPRSFSKMVLPLVAAIRWARDRGDAIFDMGGVPMDGDTDEKRAKIAHFKFDFAKEKIPVVGEHARWF